VVDESYVPQQGDLVWITLEPHQGHEQAGRRPALVITPTQYNRIRRLAVMLAITNQAKGGGLEVRLPAGLKTTGVVLVDQIRTLAYRERRAEFIETVPADLLDEVLGKLNALFSNE